MEMIKNIVNKIKNCFSKAVDKINETIVDCMDDSKGEAYVDTGVKILIAVVIGALLLAGLYTLFNSTIMPTVSQKIIELFNYTPAG